MRKDYSGRVLGASWGDLEASLGGFGLSWGCLGGSGGGLGSSWGGLRASRGGPVEACCCSLIFDGFLVRFWVDLGAQKGPKMEPKWRPKRTKIEAKIQHEKLSLLGPSWSGLGPVLGRFRTHLGLKNH